MSFRDRFNQFLDSFGLGMALVVQTGVMVVSMLRLSPGPLEAVGFVMSGIAIVMFAPRAFSKFVGTKKPRYLINYVMLEAVTLFFGWSFLLSSTLAQVENYDIVVTVDNDVVLQELYIQREALQDSLIAKRAEFEISVRPETVQAIQREQALIEEDLRVLNENLANRLQQINRGEVTQEMRQAQSGRSADTVFIAITEAWTSKRRVQVIVWFLFVGSISLMIINSLRDDDVVKKKTKEENRMPGFMEIEKAPLPTLSRPNRLSGCETCKAYELCKSPKFTVRGKGRRKILIIFDSVTRAEDHTGDAFHGSMYNYFFSILDRVGLSEEDVWVTHAVQCFQPQFEGKDTPVSPQSIAGCHSRLMANITRLKPEKIFVMGSVAMKTLYHGVNSGRFSFAQYTKFPGSLIPDQNLRAAVIPVFSPMDALKELERRKKNILKYKSHARFKRELWKDDYLRQTDSFRVLDFFILKQIVAGLKFKYTEMKVPSVQLLDSEEEIRDALKYLNDKPKYAFDIETTGLKPYAEGHEIYTWGFSDGEQIWAFRHPREERSLRVLKRLLLNDADKYGWNIQYEITWIKHFLGVWVDNWKWDGMIAAHILDNRAGITSLKFQAFAQNGVAGYDTEIDRFLTASDKKNANAINNIRNASLPRLLKYNGEDAWHTFHIAEKQIKEIESSDILKQGYDKFHQGQIALAKMSINGFEVDAFRLQKNSLELEKQIMGLEEKIMQDPLIKKWDTFNPNSSKDLIELFYDRLEYPVIERTKNGQPSTTSEVLRGFYEVYETEIARNVADYKAAVKTRDTFLEGIRRETVDNVIHPGYSLNLVTSYRSSGQNPNLQNTPMRDEEMMSRIRSVFKPRKGCVYMDIDYISLEGFMGCNYHKDPTMMKYLLDENTDMHADMAQDIFRVRAEDVDPTLFKNMRSVGKTANFALQYGSSARMLSYNLWHGHMTNRLKDEMVRVGVKDYEAWDKHIREIYGIYWNERFKELSRWREDTWETYVNTGRVISYTGFMYTSLMTANQVGNFPIQGSGFHVLLEGIISMTEKMEKQGLKSKFIAEIHDSVVLEVPEEEIEIIKALVRECFIVEVKERHQWITMPLRMSGEIYRDNWAVSEASEEFEIVA